MVTSAIPGGRSTAARLPSLTGLRFIAAGCVFACHIAVVTQFIGGAAGSFIARAFPLAGPYGVGFFFVLSGFVLTWTAQPDDTVRGFWRRRLVKIYPSHLATFALVALLLSGAGAAPRAVDWVLHPLLLQAWVPSLTTTMSFNPVSWSLSCEVFFYLAFPFLLPLVARLGPTRLWRAVAVVAGLILTVALFAQFLVPDQPRVTSVASGTLSFAQLWIVYFLPPVRALDFVLGMLLARIVQAGRWPRIGLLPAAGIALAGYLFMLSVPYLFATGGLAALWWGPLIAAAAVADQQARWSPVRGPVMVRLGELSFAFYLVHVLVIIIGVQFIGAERTLGPIASATAVAAMCLAALGVAWLLHRTVEMPFVRRFGRHRTECCHPRAGSDVRRAHPAGGEVPDGGVRSQPCLGGTENGRTGQHEPQAKR
jgi:peptidoglycan/LPS O-acetylase OafA/YrhL